MHIYHEKELLNDSADYACFTQLFGQAMLNGSIKPFLLVRPDGVRMQVVVSDGMLMLTVVLNADQQRVSYGSTYAVGAVSFRGIDSICEAKADNFIDAQFAMAGIEAFFKNSRLSDHFDVRIGIPDIAILDFPNRIHDHKIIKRTYVDKVVQLSPQFQRDMSEICHFLHEVEDDPDENIDFGDAIQIGSFCGGRTSKVAGTFEFTYFDASGERWSFSINRIKMESIADGGITTLQVNASVHGNSR